MLGMAGRMRMVRPVKSFLVRWMITTLSVALAVELTPMRADGFGALLAAALLLGVVNACVRPVLVVLSLPAIVLSLGLFLPVLNALMLWMAGALVPGFEVGGFWSAFFGSIVISIASGFLQKWFVEPPALSPASPGHPGPHAPMKQAKGRTLS